MNNSFPAIVCEADILAAITTIQSLGKAGIPVVAISDKKDAVGFASRYVKQAVQPEVSCGDSAFADYLIDNVEPGVIFCGSDRNAEIISLNKSKLLASGFLLTVPDHDTLTTLYDKYELHLLAEQIGITTPASFQLEDSADLLKKLAGCERKYILKPTKGAGGHYYKLGLGSDAVGIYEKLYEELNSPEYEHQSAKIMLQEFIDFSGDLWNFNGLYKDGEMIACFSGLRLRTPAKKDGSLQSSLLHGIAKTNHELVDLNNKLLNAIGYSGLVETEWLVSKNSAKYVLFDVNPRLSGNIRWAIKGGVDLPCLYYRVTTGQEIERNILQKDDVTYHKVFWNKTDLIEAFQGRSSSADNFLKILVSNVKALISPRKSAVDVFDLSDLRPTLLIVKKMLGRLTGRLGNRKQALD